MLGLLADLGLGLLLLASLVVIAWCIVVILGRGFRFEPEDIFFGYLPALLSVFLAIGIVLFLERGGFRRLF